MRCREDKMKCVKKSVLSIANNEEYMWELVKLLDGLHIVFLLLFWNEAECDIRSTIWSSNTADRFRLKPCVYSRQGVFDENDPVA